MSLLSFIERDLNPLWSVSSTADSTLVTYLSSNGVNCSHSLLSRTWSRVILLGLGTSVGLWVCDLVPHSPCHPLSDSGWVLPTIYGLTPLSERYRSLCPDHRKCQDREGLDRVPTIGSSPGEGWCVWTSTWWTWGVSSWFTEPSETYLLGRSRGSEEGPSFTGTLLLWTSVLPFRGGEQDDDAEGS